jgi:hypothetical protein
MGVPYPHFLQKTFVQVDSRTVSCRHASMLGRWTLLARVDSLPGGTGGPKSRIERMQGQLHPVLLWKRTTTHCLFPCFPSELHHVYEAKVAVRCPLAKADTTLLRKPMKDCLHNCCIKIHHVLQDVLLATLC